MSEYWRNLRQPTMFIQISRTIFIYEPSATLQKQPPTSNRVPGRGRTRLGCFIVNNMEKYSHTKKISSKCWKKSIPLFFLKHPNFSGDGTRRNHSISNILEKTWFIKCYLYKNHPWMTMILMWDSTRFTVHIKFIFSSICWTKD